LNKSFLFLAFVVLPDRAALIAREVLAFGMTRSAGTDFSWMIYNKNNLIATEVVSPESANTLAALFLIFSSIRILIIASFAITTPLYIHCIHIRVCHFVSGKDVGKW